MFLLVWLSCITGSLTSTSTNFCSYFQTWNSKFGAEFGLPNKAEILYQRLGPDLDFQVKAKQNLMLSFIQVMWAEVLCVWFLYAHVRAMCTMLTYNVMWQLNMTWHMHMLSWAVAVPLNTLRKLWLDRMQYLTNLKRQREGKYHGKGCVSMIFSLWRLQFLSGNKMFKFMMWHLKLRAFIIMGGAGSPKKIWKERVR